MACKIFQTSVFRANLASNLVLDHHLTPVMTSQFTQIVVDDDVMEYEPSLSKAHGMFAKKARCGNREDSPKFKVIHDLTRPRAQSLCLVPSSNTGFAAPVEPPPYDMNDSPKVESQWRLHSHLRFCLDYDKVQVWRLINQIPIFSVWDLSDLGSLNSNTTLYIQFIR